MYHAYLAPTLVVVVAGLRVSTVVAGLFPEAAVVSIAKLMISNEIIFPQICLLL